MQRQAHILITKKCVMLITQDDFSCSLLEKMFHAHYSKTSPAHKLKKVFRAHYSKMFRKFSNKENLRSHDYFSPKMAAITFDNSMKHKLLTQNTDINEVLINCVS